MQTEYIKEFLLTVDLKSFTKAAENLYIAQPVLSKHIKALEKEIGGKLLLRHPEGIELTPLGKEAYRSFLKIIGAYDELIGTAGAYSDSLDVPLRIGLLGELADNYVVPMVEAFSATHPNVYISYFSGRPREVIDSVIAGKVDIGFLTEGVYEDDRVCEYLCMGQAQLQAVVKAADFEEGMTAISAADVVDKPLICLRRKDTTDHINRELNYLGFYPREIIEVDELSLCPSAVVKNDGYFVILDFMVGMFTANPDLRVYPLAPTSYQKILLVKNKHRSSSVVEEFIATAKEAVHTP